MANLNIVEQSALRLAYQAKLCANGKWVYGKHAEAIRNTEVLIRGKDINRLDLPGSDNNRDDAQSNQGPFDVS